MRKLCYVSRLGILLFILTFTVLNLTVKPVNGGPSIQPTQSWTTVGTGVIKATIVPGGYDLQVGVLTAIQDGTKFDVWYTGVGSDNICRIGYASSTDRVTFMQTPGVLVPANAWESEGVLYPSVVHIGPYYFLWYTARNATGGLGGIGVAFSTYPTGPWTRSPIPVLVPSQPWEYNAILAATVLWDAQAKVFRMWYTGGGGVGTGIGYAVSLDGFSWSKWVFNPVLTPNADGSEGSMVAMPTVVKVGGLFWMWYFTTTGIRSAYSLDGITWTKWSQNPVLTGPNAFYPSVFPWFDSNTGQLRMGMYYGLNMIDYAECNFGLGTAPLFMNPPIGETYFINADPAWSPQTAYDSLSSGILYGLQPGLTNHYMGFSYDPWVVQGGADNGRLLLAGKWVVTMGGPLPHPVVGHYEKTSLSTPVYYEYNPSLNTNEFHDMATKALKASMSTTADYSHEDYVVIEQFSADGNNIMMIYGFAWRGTWAGGIYFKDYFWTHSNEFVGLSYVILHWTDTNMDGKPQADEISVYAGG